MGGETNEEEKMNGKEEIQATQTGDTKKDDKETKNTSLLANKSNDKPSAPK